jgi:hypothetical protein
MLDLCRIVSWIVVDLLRSRAALEAEILVLQQQVVVLRRGRPSRLSFLTVDKVVLGWVCHLFVHCKPSKISKSQITDSHAILISQLNWQSVISYSIEWGH